MFAQKTLFLFILLLISFFLHAKEVVVDLREPEYSEGIITTSLGGVIRSGKIRIQATHMTYNKVEETLIAKGDLFVIYGHKILIGSSLEYNFKTCSGFICDGVVAEEPVVMGGEKIILEGDGSYRLENGYITLWETCEEDFAIHSKCIRLLKNNMLIAKDVCLRFFSIPLFTLSSFNTHMDSVSEIPIQVKFTFGGIEGSAISLRYRALTWKDLKVYLRADYVLSKGPGGGIDADYCSVLDKRSFILKNFMVQDRSYDDPVNRLRYRFEGTYDESFKNNVHARLVYDVLSDSEMASDFSADEFNLDTGEHTHLLVTKKEDSWIADFSTRVRVNDFQTVNQQLPAIEASHKPISHGATGIISDHRIRAGFLDYAYADGTPPPVSDFHATRIELDQEFYRPFTPITGVKITPEVALTGIFYDNNPQAQAVMQAVGRAGLFVNAKFSRLYGQSKHIVEPYASFQYYSHPTVRFNNYYVFDIEDGYARLQILRFGFTNSLFLHGKQPIRALYLNIFADAFFSVHTLQNSIPRIYGSLLAHPTPYLTTRYDIAWNTETKSLDFFNLTHLWTINEDYAIGLDFLHRGIKAWRKADYTNFMLDAQQPEYALLHSNLSDRRNTLLVHFFYRFHPNWCLEMHTRSGWHRLTGQLPTPETEPNYKEFKIDLSTFIGCNWNLKLSYEHREIDNRFFMSFKLGENCPKKSNPFQSSLW
ncbi:MAG: hypothetical protein P4L16_04395 [Chlamydiales bacterium]|nr:hypothetical protein [Chlamydiales bacterium]